MPRRQSEKPVAASTVRRLREYVANLEQEVEEKRGHMETLQDTVDDFKAKIAQLELDAQDRPKDIEIARLKAEIEQLKQSKAVQIDLSPIEITSSGVVGHVPDDPHHKSTFFSVPGRIVTAWFQIKTRMPDTVGYQIEIKAPL